MKKNYPKILKTIKKTTNISAKCKCGNLAKFKLKIAVNELRSDDVFYWACKVHKNDSNFFLG